MFSRAASASLAALVAVPALGQTTVFVPDDYTFIQDAIDDLDSGDTIRVRPGTYFEHINYSGTDLTIVSMGGPSVTTINGLGSDTVVVFENGESNQARLEGFTITNGQGIDGAAVGRGGGIHCDQTSPVIVNCIIKGNVGSAGATNHCGAGGIHCLRAPATIIDCLIENNTGGQATAFSSETGSGGIYIKGPGLPGSEEAYIANCIIRGNIGGNGTDAGSQDAGAGGISLDTSATTILGCIIENNIGGSGGDEPNVIASEDRGGTGGLFIFRSNPLVSGCIVRNNQGGTDGPGEGPEGGGGIQVHSSPPLPMPTNCTIMNCIISGNSGGTGEQPSDTGAGGGIHCNGLNMDDAIVVNCTVFGNTGGLSGAFSAGGAGGIDVHGSDRLRILNTVVWGNTGAGTAPDNLGHWTGPIPWVRHSLIGGGWPGAGNVNADPLIVDPVNEDFRIPCDSPCVNAGNLTDELGSMAPDVDFDGLARDDGLPDIGAYEVKLGQNYCTGIANSTGAGARMSVAGCSSLGLNDFELRALEVPNTPGIFFYGPNQIQVAFGDGLRCVGGAIRRLSHSTAMNNVLSRTLDLSQTSISPGSTVNFQAWFRDPGAGGAGFNTSDGISVSFVQ